MSKNVEIMSLETENKDLRDRLSKHEDRVSGIFRWAGGNVKSIELPV